MIYIAREEKRIWFLHSYNVYDLGEHGSLFFGTVEVVERMSQMPVAGM